MKTKFLKILLALTALFVAPSAFAATIDPGNGLNAMDLYVEGNGLAIHDILQSITMMFNHHVFTVLMLGIATIGFVVLAVKASFDPGKNLTKMFSYFFVIWLVTFLSSGLRVNLTINDRITGYYQTVPGVPAVIGYPAALTSEVGHYITKWLEQYYTVPGPLTLSGKGDSKQAGTFGIFGKMISDASKIKISNPGLQKSLSAYVSDCAVPAIALGRMHTTDLVRSTDLMATLRAAASQSHLTRFYPGESYVPGPGAEQNGNSELLACAPGTTVQGQMGALLTCKQAYSCLQMSMKDHGQALLKASAAQWSDTGVMTPLGTELGAALSWAEGGIDTGVDTGTDQGASYVKQQAMINAMTGAFRHAAMQSDNNEMLTSTAISQAEQNQRGFWVSSAIVFKRMMGYVYTTVQALIFAIAPVAVVALLIPGFGFLLYKSYGQILLWLALWEPMLSVVNYLIALFGKQSVGSSLAQWGGLTMQNSWTISSQANDLMIAAAFLGTMTPLILWGLIKGSMAFTEFITHGVGAQYAAQAGATMGSGNVGLNNMQMDNVNTSKYNTASSIAVGEQGVQSMMGAGTVTSVSDAGGAQLKMNNSAISLPVSRQVTHQKNLTHTEQVQKQKAFNSLVGSVQAYTHGNKAGDSTKASREAKRSLQQWQKFAHEHNLSAEQADQLYQDAVQKSHAGQQLTKNEQAALSLGASIGANLGFFKVNAGADVKGAMQNQDTLGTSQDNSLGVKHSGGVTTRDGSSHSAGGDRAAGSSASVGTAYDKGSFAQYQEVGQFIHQATQSGLVTNGWAYGESNTMTWTTTISVPGAPNYGGYEAYLGADSPLTPTGFEFGTSMDSGREQMNAMEAGVNASYAQNNAIALSSVAAGQGALITANAKAGAQASPTTGVLNSIAPPDTQTTTTQVNNALGAEQAKIKAQGADRRGKVDKGLDKTHQNVTSVNPFKIDVPGARGKDGQLTTHQLGSTPHPEVPQYKQTPTWKAKGAPAPTPDQVNQIPK